MAISVGSHAAKVTMMEYIVVRGRLFLLTAVMMLTLPAPQAQSQPSGAVAAPVQSAPGHVLTLRVEGVRSGEGQLRAQLLVRKQPAAAPDTVGFVVEPALAGIVTLTFRDLPAGDYAVQLFHDENGNGKVDLNLAGVPTEGFGFSNVAQVRGGIPAFEQMMVRVTGDATATTVLAYAP
jgi:uncharacterized protein (DUF2141 family)